MGTFLGHFVPGLAFVMLGIWHTLNTIKAYKLKGPSNFTSTTWFPFPSTVPSLKHLELYLLLAFSVLAIAGHLVDMPLRPDTLEHATMYLHLAVYASVALAVDVSPHHDTLRDVVAAAAASVFGQELFILRFHSADHAGLEGHYHWLLQLAVASSLLAAVAMVALPRSFAVALVRSASILFQGLWFLVMGFALWVPRLVPRGCFSVVGGGVGAHSAVACSTEEASRRAVAMANLQFSWVLAGVWVVTACLCLRVDCKGMEYRQLREPGGDVGAFTAEGEGQKRVPHASAQG